MDNLMLRRRVLLGLLNEDYIIFEDPVVEQICATTWGDGIGLKPSQAAAVTTLGSTFTGNTEIVYFDELRYFGITTIGASLQDCSSLKKLWIPSSVAGNNWCSSQGMRGLSSLEELTIEAPLKASGAGIYGNGSNRSDLDNLKKVNIDDLSTWLNCNFNNRADYTFSMKSGETHLYYIGSNTEITSVDIPSTYTSIGSYAFYNCKGLTSVTIPNTVTAIGLGAFQGCTGLSGTFTIPSSVTSFGGSCFRGLTGLTNLIMNTLADPMYLFYTELAGNGTGTLWFNAGVNATSNNTPNLSFKNIVVTGNFNSTLSSRYALGTSANLETIRISGNLTSVNIIHNSTSIKFCECNGTLSGANGLFIRGGQRGVIVHLGYNGIACAPNIVFSSNATTSTYWTKIYVGDGSSAAHDNAILAQYTSDTNWSAYSDRLDTWYNYIQSGGEYATSPTIPTS